MDGGRSADSYSAVYRLRFSAIFFKKNTPPFALFNPSKLTLFPSILLSFELFVCLFFSFAFGDADTQSERVGERERERVL